jgi:predicted dehydrogenase
MINLVNFKKLNIPEKDILMIKQFPIKKDILPDFQNKLRKVFFFIFREGLFETIRKIKSLKWYNKHLEKYKTVIIVKSKEKHYYNLSIQNQNNVNDFIVYNYFHFFDDEIESKNLENIIDLIFSEKKNFIQYSQSETESKKGISFDIVNAEIVKYKTYDEGLFLYGLGGYSFTHILPNLKKIRRLACIDYKVNRSTEFKKQYDFEYCFQHPFETKELLEKTIQPIVVIATYHSDHAALARWVFDINPKTVFFIEKPPTVTLEDRKLLDYIYDNKGHIEIGFNRRYIKLNKSIKEIVDNKKIFVTISVKEVLINENHWYNWPNQGTRLTGNIVHWLDISNYWIDSNPLYINMTFSGDIKDDFVISIAFENGSFLTIISSDKGNSLRGVQEVIEIRFDNETILIEDYLRISTINSSGKKKVMNYFIRDKGHHKMYKEFSSNLQNKNFNYKKLDLNRTMLLTEKCSFMLINKINYYAFNQKEN